MSPKAELTKMTVSFFDIFVHSSMISFYITKRQLSDVSMTP